MEIYDLELLVRSNLCFDRAEFQSIQINKKRKNEMMHFFEKMERDIDFAKEYNKIEQMILAQNYPNTLENAMEKYFLNWEDRGNFTSFMELREHLGFPYSKKQNGYLVTENVDMEKYFLFCEMIMNVSVILPRTNSILSNWESIFATMEYNISKVGFEIKNIEDRLWIVSKNAVAVEVADSVPEVADVVIEYNHYLLRGDITRKKEILRKLADALEPKRTALKGIDGTKTTDFFNLVNNLNIRHNNVDPADPSKYKKGVAALSKSKLEEYYDAVYQQALTLFVLLEQSDLNKKIDEIKRIIAQ